MIAKADVIEQYAKNGFAVLRNVIDKDLIEETKQHVDWLIKKHPNLRPEHLHHPLIRDDAFWVRLVTDHRLLDIAELFLGSNLACFTAHYICKPPFDGYPVLWHQDGAYWKLEPMEGITLWLAVDESTSENGCLRMIPGSHKLPLQMPESRTNTPNMLFSSINTTIVENLIEASAVVDVVLQPGDVSIHHPQVVHGSEPNTSPKRRCGLDMGFIKTSTRISNQGLYLDPILARGVPVEGINNYRMYPKHIAEKTISFKGSEEWNRKAEIINQENIFFNSETENEDAITVVNRMIRRLRQGTLKE
jgi:phytanoyl-CoA hydroxylase